MSPSGGAGSGVVLRPAVAADRDFLLRVYASTRETELAQLPLSTEQRAAFCVQQFEAQSMHYARNFADAASDVILRDGVPVGRLIVGHWAGEVRIAEIALLPEACGQGVGTEILRRVIAGADARGVPTTIHVEPLNPAARLYRRLGFVTADGASGGVRVLLERPPTRPDQPKTTS